MSLPGVSYVIPLFNKADCLPLTLRQIERQTGNFARQYIFINDGSTDGSLDIVRHVTADWSDVVIRTQENRGSAHATNRGIEYANQPYIKFVDADDVLTDTATLTLLKILDGVGDDICAAYGEMIRQENMEEIDVSIHVRNPNTEYLQEPLFTAMQRSIWGPSACLVRTSSVKAVGGCDERVLHSQEYGLTLRLARQWGFVRVNALIGFVPRFVKQRLSHDQPRQLQRMTRALGLFVGDHPDLPMEYKRHASHRAAGRAWLFARRNKLPTRAHHLCRYLYSKTSFVSDHAEFIDECCEAFEPSH